MHIRRVSALLLFAAFCPLSCQRSGKDTKALNPVMVTGIALYEKRILQGQNFSTVMTPLKAIRYAQVVAVTENDQTRVLNWTVTDENGRFSLLVDNNNAPFRVRVMTKTKDSVRWIEVVNPNDGYKTYFVESDALIESTSDLVLKAEISPVNCQSFSQVSDAKRRAPAFNIFDTLSRGATFVNQATRLRPPKVYALWEDGAGGAAGITAYLGARTSHGDIGIALANASTQIYPNLFFDTTSNEYMPFRIRSNGDNTFSLSRGSATIVSDVRFEDINALITVNGDNVTDPDHFDDHVLLAAYARFLQHFYSRDDAVQPAELKQVFVPNTSTTTGTAKEMLDFRTAWSQGFADFFACLVLRRDGVVNANSYVDTKAMLNPCATSGAQAQSSQAFDIEEAHKSYPVLQAMKSWPVGFNPGDANSTEIKLDPNSQDRNFLYANSATYSGRTRGYPRLGELTATVNANNTVSLTWDPMPPSGQAYAYNVYASTTSGFWTGTPPVAPAGGKVQTVASTTTSPVQSTDDPLSGTNAVWTTITPAPTAGQPVYYVITYTPTGGTEIPITDLTNSYEMRVVLTAGVTTGKCLALPSQSASDQCRNYADTGSFVNTNPLMDDIVALSGTGYSLEVAVAALLWDLSDDSVGLDSDSDATSGGGFADIWEVLTTYLPNQDWVYLADFLDGWFSMGKADPTDMTAFNKVANRLAIFYAPPTASEIGNRLHPATAPPDTFPINKGIFGAVQSPVQGNNVADPATGATVSIHANSQSDPFSAEGFPAGQQRAAWRSSSSFYVIEVAIKGRLRIELRLPSAAGGTASNDLNLFLYGSDMRPVPLSSSQLTTQTEVIDVEVKPGIYYAEVRSWQITGGAVVGNSTSAPYDLVIFTPF